MPWLWKAPKSLHCHSGSIPRSHRKPRHKSGAKPFCTSQRAPTVEVASNFSPDMRSFWRNRRGVLEMRDPQNQTMSTLKQSSIFRQDDNWFPMTLQTSTCRCPDHQEFLASSSNPGQSRPEMAGCGVSRPAHIMRHWRDTCDRTHVFTRRFHSEFRSVMPRRHWIKGTYPLVN